MSVIVVARLFPKPGLTAEYLGVYAQYAAAVHAEHGCEYYAANEAADGTIVMIEKWEAQSDLDAHLKAPHVAEYREARQPFEAKPPQLETLTPFPAGDPAKGAL